MRIVALVPAAGESRRMGRPKLVLRLGRDSIIQRVVAALLGGGADAVLVMAPPVATPGAVQLANHARVEGAEVVHLEAPTPDMRATVERGLDALLVYGLAPADGVLLTPGDVPGLTPRLVLRVLRHFQADPTRIVVPAYRGKRGHPVALPWTDSQAIFDLPAGEGVRVLLEQPGRKVVTIEADDEGAITDIDTPEDYRRWAGS
jgi:molybdenum cofactor cytidylyltransferase